MPVQRVCKRGRFLATLQYPKGAGLQVATLAYVRSKEKYMKIDFDDYGYCEICEKRCGTYYEYTYNMFICSICKKYAEFSERI